MNELLDLIVNLLKEQQKHYGYFEIYPSFDSVPVSIKSKKVFVVISPEQFCLHQPFSNGSGKLAPFTADFRIYLLCPMLTPNEQLMQFFYSVIVPALHSGNCFLTEMQANVPQVDLKLQKIIYSSTFRMKGLSIPEQEESS